MSLESTIEKDFVRWCRSNGLITLKLNANWYRNIPDRIVILPGSPNRSFFLELKRFGERPRPGQLKRFRRLRKMGYNVYVADSLTKAIEVVEKYVSNSNEEQFNIFQRIR